MKKIISAVIFCMCFIVIGCSSLPKPEVMKADVVDFKLPKLPEDGKAIVYVVRPSSVGFAIRFNVFVDDKETDSEMGFTRGSQYIYFNLQPGEHVILSKAENWAEGQVNAKAGDIIFIQQDPSVGIIMARNSLKIIEEYEGKYHVKHLKLGTIKKLDK